MESRDNCDICMGTGKIVVYPLTDAPIWEREKEATEVKCDFCK